MRTTIRIADQLLRSAKRFAHETRRTTKPAHKPVKLTTVSGRGLRSGVDIDDSAALLSWSGLMVDINVRVYAHREDAPHHREHLAWLEALIQSAAI